MTTLHDRLADLAEDAPAGGPEPGLWACGRRLQRRRRAGTAVIVAVVVIGLGVIASADRLAARTTIAPAGEVDSGTMRLPDRFYVPSRWLPSTDDAGPIGPVSAVMGTEFGPVGVSAAEGEYRFLDLPGWSEVDDTWGATDIALSADGRRLAYWDTDAGEVRGLAVYELDTGKVERWSFDSTYGLAASGIVWVGDQVWFSAGTIDDASRTSSSGGSTHVWDLATGKQSTQSAAVGPSFANFSSSGTTLVETDGRNVDFYESPQERPQRRRTDQLVEPPVVLSPDGGRLAAALDVDGSSTISGQLRPLVVLSPGAGGRLESRRIPGVRSNDVIAWRDPAHLIVLDYRSGDYRTVDVTTGATAPLVTPTENWAPGLQVAADAWRAPTYAAPKPPTPLDPRLVWGGGIAVVVLGGGAVVLWRRRVRA